MRRFVLPLKLITGLTLLFALGACAGKSKKEDSQIIGGSRPSTAPDSALAGATEDLRNSSRFSRLSQNIRFNVGSAELTASSRRALNGIATELNNSANSFQRIRIAGFADPQGDSERNLRLSEERAQNVRNYLISKGVPESKLETLGKGAVARESLSTASQRAQDRRVDFEIVE